MVAVRLWCVDESDGVVPSREWMEAAQKAARGGGAARTRIRSHVARLSLDATTGALRVALAASLVSSYMYIHA